VKSSWVLPLHRKMGFRLDCRRRIFTAAIQFTLYSSALNPVIFVSLAYCYVTIVYIQYSKPSDKLSILEFLRLWWLEMNAIRALSSFRYLSCGFNFQSVVCLRTLRSSHSLRSSWSLRNSGAGVSDHLIS
jgi:hypothetical protein